MPGGLWRTFVVVAVDLVSGSWGAGTATGVLTLAADTDDAVKTNWSGNGILNVGLTSYATASSDLAQLAAYDQLYAESLYLAMAYRRSLIGAVPGYGPVLGVCVFKQNVYAFRAAAALPEYGRQHGSCTMYKQSSSGWTSVRSGIPYVSGDTFRFFVGSFTGSSEDHARCSSSMAR